LAKKFCMKNACVKPWWNWLLMSVSSTFGRDQIKQSNLMVTVATATKIFDTNAFSGRTDSHVQFFSTALFTPVFTAVCTWYFVNIQCPPLNRITLGSLKSDNNNRMIQLTDVFCVLLRYNGTRLIWLQYAADYIIRDPIKRRTLYWISNKLYESRILF